MTDSFTREQGAAASRTFVGTSGWAYTTWKPGFYPPKLASRKFLEHYATRLNTVEVNYTFRALPTAQMLSKWLAATVAGFRFSFKAPQRITHVLRLKNCEEAVTDFTTALIPIVNTGSMGALLYQLPPNFKADVARLDDFLAFASKSGHRLAFEFRHDSWFTDDVYSTLGQHKAALCVAESDDLATPDVRTADFACYRLRKSNYSEDDLREVTARLKGASAMGDVFAYFKHETDPTGALRAEAVLRKMDASR